MEKKRAEASGSADETVDLSGKQIGDFRIVSRIGRGGMGEVYLAEQLALRRHVALKILRADMLDDPQYLARFEAEAKAVAPISHPNIVSVYVTGKEGSIHYIAMEYVQGINLREYIDKKGRLDAATCITVMKRVAAALQRASEEGIVHRDIKPENVLLTKKGEVKVADFGLARQISKEGVNVTQTGLTMGTPLYMSPEQIEGKPVDRRTDIYSFGVTCYHMIAGSPPFQGDNAFAIAVQHLNRTAPSLETIRPEFPVDVIRIVERMMAKKPEDRYPSAREVLQELARLRGAKNTVESPALPPETTSPAETAPEGAGKSSRLSNWSHSALQPIHSLAAGRPSKGLVVGLTLLAALTGAAVAWSGRESMLISRPAAAPLAVADANPPDTSGIKAYGSGWLQLEYAQSVLPPEQREAGLWAVLEQHKSDLEHTIRAAYLLARMYVEQRQMPKLHALARVLIGRDAPSQRSFGHLLRGLAQARDGQPSEAAASFLTMLDESRKIDADTGRANALTMEEIQWLTRQYAAASYLIIGGNATPEKGPRVSWLLDSLHAWRGPA